MPARKDKYDNKIYRGPLVEGSTCSARIAVNTILFLAVFGVWLWLIVFAKPPVEVGLCSFPVTMGLFLFFFWLVNKPPKTTKPPDQRR